MIHSCCLYVHVQLVIDCCIHNYLLVFCLDDLKIARERLVSKEDEMAKTMGMYTHTA